MTKAKIRVFGEPCSLKEGFNMLNFKNIGDWLAKKSSQDI